ncbi:MAG: YbhB/YbcL family Raf kinase inhibitor-like protein [Planctomycetes bacterium]|nr:YbhB/YbcL family Raf kinase inhibitor-like protein [Planctomycetota bacterium]
MQLTSTAFRAGEPIPVRYTADGENLSPPLQWANLPDGTRELALIVEDPDAPQPTPWVHWLIYRIGADYPYLPAGIDPVPLPELPPGARQGANSANTIGYRGPALPPGHGVHRYRFRLYALDEPLIASPGLDKAGLLSAMQGHILGTAELVGTYGTQAAGTFDP